MPFLDSPVAPARCEPAPGAGRERASARRIWHHPFPPSPELAAAARAIGAAAASTPGKVLEADDAPPAGAHGALRAFLPASWHGALRPRLQWYACRGAFFHHDPHFCEVLFGAWCLDGPARRVIYPRLGLDVSAGPGWAVVFDPFEPHGVLDEGEATYRRDRYDGAGTSVFLGFELALDAALRSAFGIEGTADGSAVLSSRTAVNAETGAIAIR